MLLLSLLLLLLLLLFIASPHAVYICSSGHKIILKFNRINTFVILHINKIAMIPTG